MTRIYGMEKRRRAAVHSRQKGENEADATAVPPYLASSLGSLDAPRYLVPSIAASCLSAPLTYIPSYRAGLKEPNVFPSKSAMNIIESVAEKDFYVYATLVNNEQFTLRS